MEEKKLNITSSVVEQGIEGIKEFLGKLIMPAVEEVGLLAKDHITLWRYKNQVKMLSKAMRICDESNINPKTISLKLLCPLLDYAGLEEDEQLLDKWANLLANMVDSEQNVHNHVFPYILSQLSKGEFIALESAYDKFKLNSIKYYEEWMDFKNSKDSFIKDYKYNDFHLANRDYELIDYELEIQYKNYIKNNALVPTEILKGFELANTIRLGIVKESKEIWADPQGIDIPDKEDGYITTFVSGQIESETNYLITDLGELFIVSCKRKNNG